jgi:nucleoside-diphosphate-sugar epimerase
MSPRDEPSAIGVIVTGATGWVGRRVAASLGARGVPVIGVGRMAAAGPWSAFHEGDMSDARFASGRDWASSLSAARSWALVHCAGLAHQPRETGDVRRQMHAINALGTRHVVALCHALHVQRLIYVSSISVYDWQAAPVDSPRLETDKVAPATAYAASKLAGEETTRESGIEWQVIRLATVFGDGDRANFAKLARGVRSGRFVFPGAGLARKSVISVDLAGSCLAELAISSVAPGQTLNLALPEAPSLGSICREMAVACRARTPSSAPLVVLAALARCGDVAEALKLPSPLTTATLRKLTTSTEVDSSRAVQLLPMLGRETFAGAMQSAAEYYRRLA